MIDLRSDTVTKPTAPMREAMARAEVGDDVYGEDPTVRVLEETVASLLGKEAALFVPSGTMGNQLAIMTHTRRGDEVVCGEGAHLCWFESGAGAALSGVQFAVAGKGGLFTAERDGGRGKTPRLLLPAHLAGRDREHPQPRRRTRVPRAKTWRHRRRARELELGLHLDGARMWNASAATGVSLAQLAGPFDTVSVCFSKGLGAPVGSALAGSKAQIERSAPLAQDARGGHAPGGHPRGRRAPRHSATIAADSSKTTSTPSSSPASSGVRSRTPEPQRSIPKPTSSTSTCRPSRLAGRIGRQGERRALGSHRPEQVARGVPSRNQSRRVGHCCRGARPGHSDHMQRRLAFGAALAVLLGACGGPHVGDAFLRSQGSGRHCLLRGPLRRGRNTLRERRRIVDPRHRSSRGALSPSSGLPSRRSVGSRARCLRASAPRSAPERARETRDLRSRRPGDRVRQSGKGVHPPSGSDAETAERWPRAKSVRAVRRAPRSIRR